MSRKHFEALAQTIKDSLALHNTKEGAEAIRFTANRIASVCAAENPRFDVARFLKACGL